MSWQKNPPVSAHERRCSVRDGVSRLQRAAGLRFDTPGALDPAQASVRDPRTAMRLRMHEIAQTRIRYGYRRVHIMLKREGWSGGRNLVYRLYCEEGLVLRRRRPRRVTCSLITARNLPVSWWTCGLIIMACASTSRAG
jgi:HTH-like domain